MRCAEAIGRLGSFRSRDVASNVSTARKGFPQGKPLPTINVLVITRRVTEVRVLQMYLA